MNATKMAMLGMALLVAVSLSVLGARGARAEFVGAFEWEDATFGSFAQKITDANATPTGATGNALRYNSPGGAHEDVTLDRAVDTVTIRSRVGASDSYVTQHLYVDGVLRRTWDLPTTATSYASRSVAVNLASGNHRINVVAANNATADSLVVDRVTLDGPPLNARSMGAFSPGLPQGGAQAIRDYQAARGVDLGAVIWFRQFAQYNIPQTEFDAVRDSGAVPIVTLEPHFMRDKCGTGNVCPNIEADPLAAINSGKYDAWVRNFADTIGPNGHNGRVLVRFAHEMNGTWYPWAGQPEKYKAAFRRVAGIINGRAPEAQMVWAPNVELENHGVGYYPGSDVVDWIGMDGYAGPPDTPQAGKSLSGRMKTTYDALKGLDPDAPFMVAETATCDGTPYPGGKPQWIKDAHLRDVPTDMPRVKLVNWFDVKKECDWRLIGDAQDGVEPGTLDAYKSVASRPEWRAELP